MFSIGRERFLKLGKFDPGFESYGGENIGMFLFNKLLNLYREINLQVLIYEIELSKDQLIKNIIQQC